MNARLTQAEALYYECEEFWKPGMVIDAPNRQRIFETAQIIPKGVKTLADIGCGNGIFLDYLQSNYNYSLLGVDRSKQALRHVNTNKLQADISKIPVADQAFDCVTCLEVLEHIPCNEYERALKELTRISGRFIIISVPYNEKIEQNSTQCPQCKSVFNADFHFRSFTHETLKGLLQPYGFKCLMAKNIVPRKELVGYKWYQGLLKIIRNKKENSFRSPVCPVCSYENKLFAIPIGQYKEFPHRSLSADAVKSTYKKLIKSIKPHWPRVDVPGYWSMALYVKE